MRRIAITMSLGFLALVSAVRGEDAEPKVVDIAQIQAKEAEVSALQNELDRLRQQAGVVSPIQLKIRIVDVDVTLLHKLDFGFRTADGTDLMKKAEPNALDKLKLDDPTVTHGAGKIMTCSGLPANHPFFGLLDALEKQKLATSLCAPNMIVEDGVPASIRTGGEFPVPADAAAKNVAMKFYGTSAEVVAHALTDNRVRLNIRVGFSTLDESHAVNTGGMKIPALKVTEFATGFVGRLGETMVCAGQTQERAIPAGDQAPASAAPVKHSFRQLLLITPLEVESEKVTVQPATVR
jgi:Flp pilus assembly secretin CpaC